MIGKRIVLVLCVFTLLGRVSTLHAQTSVHSYWVQLTDKNNSPYSVSAPQAFLSERAIYRRFNAQIDINSQDLPVNETYVAQVAAIPGVTVLNRSRWFNALSISCTDSTQLALVQALPFVQSIDLVLKLNKPSPTTGSISEYNSESYTKSAIDISNLAHYPYGLAYGQQHLHELEALHQLNYLGQGMHIAIIDAGFENAPNMPCFEALFNEHRVLSTVDFVNHDGDVYADHFHGTAVLSTIAARQDGIYMGSAPLASFHLLRSEDANSEYLIEEANWVSAAEYADSVGADIINTSLGYTTFDDSTQNHTYAQFDGHSTLIAKAANMAASRGILVVSSAGNSGADPWKYISTPADADSVLTVGASDSLGHYAFFSSVGPAADGDIKPNVASVGYQTYVYLPYGDFPVQANGTSFSSPLMAGMAACLWQSKIGLYGLDNITILHLIEASASQYQSPDSLLGYGIPNFKNAYLTLHDSLDASTDLAIMSLYPNPVSAQQLQLLIYSKSTQDVSVYLRNLQGQVMHQQAMKLEAGENFMQLRTKDIPSGSYLLEIESNAIITTRLHEKIVFLN
ncbi:MAG: hypothetical protein RLZZ301_1104 [Bacteroidota bacterium]|jgi:hypothetical protein